MHGTIRECAHCREPRETVARSLCMRCYLALKKTGDLAKFPKMRSDEELPVREPWSWEGDEAALAAMTERLEVEKEAKTLAALNDLKQRLMFTNLDIGTKSKILSAKDAAEIEQIIASLPSVAQKPVTPEQERIERLIQQLNAF